MGESWRRRPRIGWVVAPVLTLTAFGCGVVPKSRLDDCHQRAQSLQAETVTLRDTSARLRSQNEDYAQRAVDDARRLHALEEANTRLSRSVSSYQEEVARLESEFDQLRQAVGTAASAPSAVEARRGDP